MSDQSTDTPAAPAPPTPPAPAAQPAAQAPRQPASTPQYNPAGEPAKTAPRPMHHTIPLSARPNVWRWKAKDRNGDPVEFAPGMTTLTFRGPTTPNDAKKLAAIYLYNARREAVRAGYDDPGYTLDESSLEPAGEAEPVTADNVGTWRPPGVAPLTLGVGLLEPKDGEGQGGQGGQGGDAV